MSQFPDIRRCRACSLAKVRRRVVIGRGTVPAKILVIGEAPGKSEDILGQAFVGEAGRLLDKMFRAAGIEPKDCYMTNTVLCHPSDTFAGPNREPLPEEIAACMGNVLKIADGVRPVAVILVGDYAKRFYSSIFPDAIQITHPAALLRTGGLSSPYYRKVKRILEIGAERIKEKWLQ